VFITNARLSEKLKGNTPMNKFSKFLALGMALAAPLAMRADDTVGPLLIVTEATTVFGAVTVLSLAIVGFSVLIRIVRRVK
jgi:hypothetical protein